MNSIKVNDLCVLKIEDNNFVIDFETIILKKNIFKFEILCNDCHKYIVLKHIRKDLFEKEYFCSHCRIKGEKNPFYGKTHSKESKNKQSLVKIGLYEGVKNPFYGKTHNQTTKDIIAQKISLIVKKENNPFWGKKHSIEDRLKMSEIAKEKFLLLSDEEIKAKNLKTKLGVINFQNNNIEYTKQIRRKAALASINSQKKFKINKIELIVQNLLLNIDNSFEYSVILDYKQFDFGSKKYKILVEVNGDYWHANPLIYDHNKLNKIQKEKVLLDIKKKDLAEKHGFKLFYIWEKDIKENNFEIINKIKEEILK